MDFCRCWRYARFTVVNRVKVASAKLTIPQLKCICDEVASLGKSQWKKEGNHMGNNM